MEISPEVIVTRFEQLTVGDLFCFKEDDWTCFAIKTQPFEAGDDSEMLILGPEFPSKSTESCLMKWKPTTVVSYGSNFTALLPTSPSAWRLDGHGRREAVCLAVAGTDYFVCTNGGQSPAHFDQFYVHLKTGKIVQRIQSIAAFTNEWEIVIPGPGQSVRSLLKFPLPKNKS